MSSQPPAGEPLREAVEKLILGLKKAGKSPKNKVYEIWPQVAGPRLIKHAKPYAVRGKTLYVRVDDSTWAFELRTRYRTALLARYRKALGDAAVADIRFKVGDL